MQRIIKSTTFNIRDFRVVLVGQSIGAIALSGQEIAIAWIVLEMTNSPIWVGIALALCEIPSLIFGLPAGSLADRIDRRKLLKLVEITHAFLFFSLGLLVLTGSLTLWHLLALGFCTGTVRALQEIVRLSITYDMVEKDTEVSALSLLHISVRIGTFIGFASIGSVMQRISLEAAYFSLATLSLVAFLVLLSLRSDHQRIGPPKDDMGIGSFYNELRKNLRLRTILATTAVLEILGFSFATALPFITRDILNLGPEGLGLIHATGSLGGTIALGILVSRGDSLNRSKIYLIAITLMGIFILGLAYSSTFALVLISILFIESVAVTCDVMSQALIQSTVPDHMRGRAMGAWVLAIGSLPVGQLEMGILIGALSVSSALTINGIAILGLAAFTRIALKKSQKS